MAGLFIPGSITCSVASLLHSEHCPWWGLPLWSWSLRSKGCSKSVFWGCSKKSLKCLKDTFRAPHVFSEIVIEFISSWSIISIKSTVLEKSFQKSLRMEAFLKSSIYTPPTHSTQLPGVGRYGSLQWGSSPEQVLTVWGWPKCSSFWRVGLGRLRNSERDPLQTEPPWYGDNCWHGVPFLKIFISTETMFLQFAAS